MPKLRYQHRWQAKVPDATARRGAMPPTPRVRRAKWFSWTSAAAFGVAVGAGAYLYYHHLLEPAVRRRDADDGETPTGETKIETSPNPSASPATPGASSAVGGSPPSRTPGTTSPAPQHPRMSKKERHMLAASRAQSELLGSLEDAGAFGDAGDDGASVRGAPPWNRTTSCVSVDAAFADAARRVEGIMKRLTTAEKLRIYGLYKQATEGPCATPKPRLLEGATKHAKWMAWSEVGELDSEKAKREYVALVRSLTSRSGDAGAGKANETDGIVEAKDERDEKEEGTFGGPVFSRPEVPFDAPNGPGGFEGTFLNALSEACRSGDARFVEKLFSSGGESLAFDTRDCEGRTALHWASDGGHFETAEALLRGVETRAGSREFAKTFVDATDDQGQTALHYAAIVESAETCRVLMRWGADCELPDADGETPADLGARELAGRAGG